MPGASIIDDFWVKYASHIHSSINAGTPYGLTCVSLIRAACFYVFLRAPVILCVENTVSSASFTTSGSYYLLASSSAQIPETWGEGFDKDIPLRDECPQGLSLPAHCPVVGLCVNSHLLQEVSLLWGWMR